MPLHHLNYRFCILISLSLLLAALSGCSSCTASPEPAPDTAPGIAYLQSLENRDPAEIDSILTWQHEHDFAAMREERLAQLENKEITCWSLFEDYLLCGDSRSIDFSYKGFLPERNVLAKDGATILDLEEMIPEIVQAAPARLFLCYGMNDFCQGTWDSPEAWITDYARVIQEIQAQLPDVSIYICSIIPASDQLTAAQPLWTLIPDYNAALKEAVSTWENCYYVDCSGLLTEHQELYQSDGKHFLPDFYDTWGTTMIMAVFDSEFDSGSSGSSGASEDPAGAASPELSAESAAEEG